MMASSLVVVLVQFCNTYLNMVHSTLEFGCHSTDFWTELHALHGIYFYLILHFILWIEHC